MGVMREYHNSLQNLFRSLCKCLWLMKIPFHTLSNDVLCENTTNLLEFSRHCVLDIDPIYQCFRLINFALMHEIKVI